ncbi:hypothetical protein GMO17_01770 [Pseudomonas coronafaciens pv. coronafaciens]|uniref:Uncharacterized protein n=1 Tax=Pseudomonas coronafaciens pv. coronafaciens TaxID=235275 RepID=A0AAE6QL97_9PSED|nr:hypothetical protein GMO17_01770 [Pseudomonas coronafaciens pv. coronafaciens]
MRHKTVRSRRLKIGCMASRSSSCAERRPVRRPLCSPS